VKQRAAERGSLRWIQALVNDHRALADASLRGCLSLPESTSIDWCSPLREDAYAEYRDSDFLVRVGHPELRDDLGAFWPLGGPQWDALATTSDGTVVLIEAKAHLDELRSHCSASAESRALIDRAFHETKMYVGAPEAPDWSRDFYQYANRLALLYFLRSRGVPAELVFVCFLNDDRMGGPTDPAEWKTALGAVRATLGISAELAHVHDCFIDSAALRQ
jgi:hypothetical protein